MKTAVSMPDELFVRAENVSKRLRVSRSELYATAISEYLERHDDEAVTEKLNAIFPRHDNRLDPALNKAQLASLKMEKW